SAAVVHGDTGRDAHRGRPFGVVVGAQQLVGQPTGRGAVAGQRERIGEPGVQCGGPGVDGGPVQPGGTGGTTVVSGRQIRQRIGQPVVTQSVFGQPQRQIG